MSETKRGRPRKPAGEGKTERLHVLVTPLERDTLRTAAAAADVSEGEYVRRAVAYCVAAGVPLRHVTVGALPPGVEAAERLAAQLLHEPQ